MARGPHIAAILLVVAVAASPLAAQDWSLPVQAPPYTQVRAEGATLQGDPRTGEYLLNMPASSGKKSKVEAKGPFGGTLTEEIAAEAQGRPIRFQSGVIANRDPNPSALPVLPSLCPRLKALAAEPDSSTTRFVYQGQQDRLNQVPMYQMHDPDVLQGEQHKTLAEMDGRNVLLLKKVRVRYDYEDSNIIDYERFDPKTGERVTIHEGMGGFYANFHYAIVPYAKEILELPRQTLLSLAQGRLQAIGRDELRPALRTHSFLPGPFFSKSQFQYSLCEWGDTEYQAPDQSLEYEGLAMWDWDYSVASRDRVLLIVWEEDEEQELIRQRRIPENYLTDDLVGVFEIRRDETSTPLTLRSRRGDFEITVLSGDLAPRIARQP
jgi:hypothetical protein